MSPTEAPRARTSRTLPAALLLLSLAGLGVALHLVRVHAIVHDGGVSGCDYSKAVSCDTVAASEWSSFFHVPVAAWGALAYATAAGLSLAALARTKPHATFPGGLLVAVTAVMSAAALFFAGISELVIRSLCVWCAASWVISFVLLVLSWRFARRQGGVGAAVRADLAALRRRPSPFAAAGGVLALAVVALVAGYARAQGAGGPAAGAKPAAGVAGPTTGAGTSSPSAEVLKPKGPPGSLVVFEYSDYECPFCARVHESSKPVLAARTDVRVIRRHFPLDMSCNPLVKRPFHQSCALARAAICAEAQGRFEEMDDLLFKNQQEKLPLEQLARQLGLDLEKYRACVGSQETAARIASDVDAGIKAGLRGTPSFEYAGKVLAAGDLAAALADLDAHVAKAK